MKYIKFPILFVIVFLSACKHSISQLPPTAISKTADIGGFDYSIDTIDCSMTRFPDKLEDGQRELGPPRPTGYFITGLCLNRNNEDEIIVGKGRGAISTVFVLNHINQSKRVFFNNQPVGDYNFSSQGWLLCHGAERFFKIKEGNPPIPLMKHREISPMARWNHEGDKFIFNTDRSTSPMFYIANQDGQLVDSFRLERICEMDWSKRGDSLAWQRSDGTVLVTTTKRPFKVSLLAPALGTCSGFCWLDDYKTMVVSTENGLYIVNTETKQHRKIKCAAPYNSWYRDLCYSGKHKKIFARKIEILSPHSVQFILVSMNIDGTDERRIDLP